MASENEALPSIKLRNRNKLLFLKKGSVDIN